MVLSRQVTARIKEVLEAHPEGQSITDLVKSVDVNRNTAGRYLENLLLSGQVEMRRLGMAKIYTLTKRLPVSSVLSISSELVMQLDFSQRVFYANDTLLAFLGAPAKDLFGKNIEFTPFSIVFEDVFPELLDRFRKGLKGEEWHGELSRPVQGAFFFCRVAPTVFNEGTKGVSVLLEDISDQKRDEERIRKSEARLRSIFKASPVGIGVAKNRVLMEVNDRLSEMTGYVSAELVGKSTRLLFPSEEEFESVGIRKYNQMRQTGTCSIETRWVKKDGTVIDIILNSTPLDPANISGGITFTALDITERKHAEQALRESEANLNLALSGSEMGLWEMEVPSMTGTIDNRAAAILGYQKRDIGRFQADWDALSHPDDVPLIHQRFTDYLEGRTPMFESEHRMRHTSGRWIWVVGRGKITRGLPDGSKKTISGTMQDITSRKQAEQSLRESEDRYRNLAEASEDIIFVIGRDDLVEYVNSYAAASQGLPADRIIGRKRSKLFPGEPGRRQELGLQRVFESGKAVHSEGAMEIHGHIRWFDHHLMPIRDLHGTVVSVLGVSRDITNRKQAEQALKESEDRYRKLVEISPDAVILHRDGKIIYVNPAAVRLTGVGSMAEISGRDILDIVAPACRDEVRSRITEDLAGKITPPLELEILRIDGTSAMAEGRGVATFIDGRPAVMVSLTDITDRYQAGLALRMSEERYRLMFENIGAATVIVEENTILGLVNSGFERLSGFSKREIEKKKSWTEFVKKEDQERMLAWHYQRREGGDVPRQYEFRFVRRNGEIRHILITIDMIPGTTRAIASLLDITDRKLADEKIQQREQQYRFIADNSLDIINRMTPDCICTYVSPAITTLLGYTEIEVMGKPVLAMVHPDDLESVRRDIIAIVQNGSGKHMSKYRLLHKDGRYLLFESTTKVIRDEKTGQVREFLSISRDISGRKPDDKERD